MSVRKEERTVGKLDVAMQARSLAVYTLHITANKNQFDPAQNDEMINRMRRLSTDIFSKIWAANNIMVKDAHSKEERLRLQRSACIDCNTLLPLIEIACGLFHQPTKRLKFWSEKVISVRNATRAWHDSDAKRYANYK